MAKPKLETLSQLCLSNEDFSLTERQYEKSTGAPLPKSFYYLKNNSALSKIAKKYGYVVEIKEKTICLKKIS